MKKKDFLRRLVSAFLAGTMILNGVTASGENVNAEIKCLDLDVFVEDAVATALKMNNMENGTYQISDLIPVYDFNTGEVCSYKSLILFNNLITAELDIWVGTDNTYYSSFVETESNIANSYINSSSRICYGQYDDSIWLCVDNDIFYQLDSKKDVEPPVSIDYILKSVNVSSSILYEPVLNSRAVTDSIILNVSHVENDSSPDSIDNNLCWAACIAMKLNYLGLSTNLTALSLYTYLVNNEMLHEGEIDCVKDAYEEFGLNVDGGRVVAENGAIWNSLSENQPVDICISGTRSDGESESHQVLICGMAKATTGLAYKIDCPNSSNKKIVQISGDVESLLESNLSSLPYTDTWSYSNDLTINFNNVYRTYYTVGSLT